LKIENETLCLPFPESLLIESTISQNGKKEEVGKKCVDLPCHQPNVKNIRHKDSFIPSSLII
jgi:hypothetical protein